MAASQETSVCVHATNNSKLSFKSWWQREHLSDLKLCCGQKEFVVHRFLLAACSPYFRCLFQKRPGKNVCITIDNVNGDDLGRVLYYIYHGSISMKNNEVQRFCELLEMFMMPLPADINVSSSESDSESDVDSQSDTAGESVEMEHFVRNVGNILQALTKDSLKMRKNDLLNLMTTESKINIVVEIILRTILKIEENALNRLIVDLVFSICFQRENNDRQMCIQYFGQTLRMNSLQLLRYMCSVISTIAYEEEPANLHRVNGILSLDKQVNSLKVLKHQFTLLRYKRLAHFIDHLLDMNLINLNEINNIVQNNPYIACIPRSNNICSEDCCSFELSSATKEILNDVNLKHAQSTEEEIFWTRNKAFFVSNLFGFR